MSDLKERESERVGESGREWERVGESGRRQQRERESTLTYTIFEWQERNRETAKKKKKRKNTYTNFEVFQYL
jgi:hypothetical protein